MTFCILLQFIQFLAPFGFISDDTRLRIQEAVLMSEAALS